MNTKKLIIIVLLIILLIVYNQFQISKFKINRVSIESEKLSSEIRISQITDFHSNNKIDITKLVQNIRDYKPNIIVLTGDIIDSKTEDLSLAYALVDGINTVKAPIFFVEGNHEELNPKREEFLKGLKEKGINILDNKTRMVYIEEEKLRLIGVSFCRKRRISEGLG